MQTIKMFFFGFFFCLNDARRSAVAESRHIIVIDHGRLVFRLLAAKIGRCKAMRA